VRELLAFGVELLLFVLVHFLHHGIAAGFAGGLSCRGRRAFVGIEVCPGGVVAGRVAVALGGDVV